jgi:hypothetical protein
MKAYKRLAKALTVVSLLITASNVTLADNTNNKQQFVELLPKDFRPAFTKETVIKLNAIVRRSYDVINEYDAIIEQTYNSAMQASKVKTNTQYQTDAQQKLSKVKQLQQRSGLALSDMMSAVEVLRKSGEEHNKAVLAGMINFVKDVDQEISRKNAEIDTLLNKT